MSVLTLISTYYDRMEKSGQGMGVHSMNQSPYRWVIVGAGALMGCIAIGAMFSLAVFLQPMSAETGWSRAGISSAMTIGFLTMGAGGFFWGSISDRYGARICALIGSVLLGLALTLASRA